MPTIFLLFSYFSSSSLLLLICFGFLLDCDMVLPLFVMDCGFFLFFSFLFSSLLFSLLLFVCLFVSSGCAALPGPVWCRHLSVCFSSYSFSRYVALNAGAELLFFFCLFSSFFFLLLPFIPLAPFCHWFSTRTPFFLKHFVTFLFVSAAKLSCEFFAHDKTI